MRRETSKSTAKDDEFWIFYKSSIKDTSKDENYFTFLLVVEFCLLDYNTRLG